MGAALPVAAVAMMALGPVVEGIGANKEARAAARADEENARLAVLSGEQDVGQIMRDERDQAGEALAMMAGSGLMVGTGSARDVIEESARQRDRDIRIRRRQAQGERRNYQQAAADKRAAGRNALIAGAFGGVANALAGANAQRNQRLGSAQADKERRSQRGGG